MLIESHCHLDYLKAEPLADILLKAKVAGVFKLVTIGVDPENLDLAMGLADSYQEIYFTQGIHPHDSKAATPVEFEKIKIRSTHAKMIAVGEIGLDYHYDNSPREIQRKVFEEQLQIASDLNLPVVIHTREAEADTMAILKNFSPTLKSRGVIHSFTSSLELAEFVLKEEFFIGFNGIITFKNAANVQAVVKITPLDKILLETDSPFLTPVPHRGKENAPYYLPFVAEKISELKGIPLEQLKPMIIENTLRCFPKLRS
jgi:TatD DNase family protein